MRGCPEANACVESKLMQGNELTDTLLKTPETFFHFPGENWASRFYKEREKGEFLLPIAAELATRALRTIL